MAKRKELIENVIYRSIIGLCEKKEHEGMYRGNGHHLAQELTKAVSEGMLPKQKKMIYDAMNGAPMKTIEIAKKVNLPSKNVSAQLKQMEKETLLVHFKKQGRFTLWYK